MKRDEPCDLCHEHSEELFFISKQIGRTFKHLLVCAACHEKHHKELEMLRKNFYMQFGDR